MGRTSIGISEELACFESILARNGIGLSKDRRLLHSMLTGRKVIAAAASSHAASGLLCVYLVRLAALF